MLIKVKGPNGTPIMIEEGDLKEYQAALYTVVETSPDDEVETPGDETPGDETAESKQPALPVAEKVVISKSAKKLKGTKVIDSDESNDDFDPDYEG